MNENTQDQTAQDANLDIPAFLVRPAANAASKEAEVKFVQTPADVDEAPADVTVQ